MSNANPKITIAEANRVLEEAYPLQGVTINLPAGPSSAYKITKANGEVLGQAFDLLTATRQAVTPALKVEAQKRLDLDKARTAEFIAFQQFLREKFSEEFSEYVQAKNAANQPTTSDPVRAADDQPRLVPELPK